jgi:hypothetical protein
MYQERFLFSFLSDYSVRGLSKQVQKYNFFF